MKKILLLLIINFIVFAFLVFSCDGLLKKHITDPWVNNAQDYMRERLPRAYDETDISDCETEKPEVIQLEYNEERLRQYCGEGRVEFGSQYENKNPIVVLGCSYAYGHGLKKEKSFPAILSRLTKRPVFSFAGCGGNALWSMNTIKSDEYWTQNVKNSDYYIYIYMYDHVNRYTCLQILSDYYDEIFDTGNLERIIDKLYIVRIIKSAFKIRAVMRDFPNGEKAAQIIKAVMFGINKQIKSVSPNAKLIIIVYDEKLPDYGDNNDIRYKSNTLNSHIWNELNKENDITVVHTKDLTGFYFDKNYKLKADIADWHPNEKAWKLLTPMIVKKYIK